MKITPLDLKHQKFRKSFRGLDPQEVHELLDLVGVEWEESLRQNQKLQDELDRVSHKLKEYQEKEKMFQDTFVTVQKLAEEAKQNSQKEAEIMISQAEIQADKIIRQAHHRLTQMIDDINGLKRQRVEFEAKIKAILEAHLRLLELQKENPEGVQIEDVTMLPKAM